MLYLCCCFKAQELYDKASAIFNRTSTDKSVGYITLKKAADMGHQLAKAELAWAHLLGHFVELDIYYAKAVFEKLVDLGIPQAHMVNINKLYPLPLK